MSDRRVPPDARSEVTAGATDDLRVIERELALLMRRLEEARRTVHADGPVPDRAAYLLLDQIELREHPTAADMAEFLQLDHSTMTRQLRALEHDGLIERLPNPTGGRGRVLSPTERGRELLLEARRQRAGRMDSTLADWSDRDRRTLGRLLGRLNEAFERRTAPR